MTDIEPGWLQRQINSTANNQCALCGSMRTQTEQPVDISMLRRKAKRGLFGKDGILKEQFLSIQDAIEFVIDLVPTCVRTTKRESVCPECFNNREAKKHEELNYPKDDK